MSHSEDPKPSHHAHHHRQAAPEDVPSAVITVSDTRDLETDTGGRLVEEMLLAAGRSVTGRQIVKDDPAAIREAFAAAIADPRVRAVVFTGGTGIAPRDVTPDTLEPELERVIPGFGELFRMLSYEDIGSAACCPGRWRGSAAGRSSS